MKVTFLGTGTSQGVPVILCNCEVCKSLDERDKRLRSSIMIELNNTTIVIDTGPDFRQQMLRSDIKHLDAVLFTHAHKDHTGGLDDVRAFNYIQQKPMDIYAEQRVIESLKSEYAYVFAKNKYPGIPQIKVHVIDNKPFTIGDTIVTPIRAIHYKLPIFGYRINDFTYLTDANFIDDKELEKIKGSKVLVINALRKEKHISHFTLNEALNIIDKIKPEQAFLTHLSHLMGLHNEVSKELPENTTIAIDNQTIII